MPEGPRPDLEKIRRIHGSLRRYTQVNQNEKFHRWAIAILILTGFIGTIFFGHGGLLLEIAVVYLVIAIWRGYITFAGRRLGGRRAKDESGDSAGEDT